jgi:hypothetical protein
MSSFGSKQVSDCFDILSTSGEGKSNHINIVLKSEINDIILILVGNCGKIDTASWEIHIFLFSEFKIVVYLDNNAGLVDFKNVKNKFSVSSENSSSNFNRLRKIFVTNGYFCVITFEGVVSS